MADRRQRGGALVLTLFVLLLFTLLGAAALQMGQTELEQERLQAQQARAAALAESGIELAIGWFAHPERFDGGTTAQPGACAPPAHPGELFRPRCLDGIGFHDADDVSQFRGTAQAPDGAVVIPAASLFPMTSDGSGGTMEIRVFQPLGRGAVCTVLATGRIADVAQSAQVELAVATIPQLTAAAGAPSPNPSTGPSRLHWGSLRYGGDDGGWAYATLKRWARRYGRYYGSDGSGRLYRDGQGPALSPDDVLADDDAAPLIFIDTIDGQPPRGGADGNMPTIVLSTSSSRSLIYLAGDLALAPAAEGRSLSVPSPTAGEPPVALDKIHFTGGFYAAGRVRVTAESRLFGAVYAAQGFDDGAERLEVWYDGRWRAGTLPGWPVVMRLPGSWRPVFD